MRQLTTVTSLREAVVSWRSRGLRIGLVPTMGFLHEGHLSLMRLARQQCDRLIVTIFVNPMQFGPNEDLDAYPRDLPGDAALAEKEGVDLLFCPPPDEIYSSRFQTVVRVKELSKGLCGADRPGHFDGVATVVTKLFNLTEPQIAVFGQKDFQQLALIRQLADDLNYSIEIIGHPIVRENDGLAMSSRNKYLDEDDRVAATSLYQAILAAQKMFRENRRPLPSEEIRQVVVSTIEAFPQCRVDYAEIIDRSTLTPLSVASEDGVLAIAVKVSGKVRLIDNGPLAGDSRLYDASHDKGK